MMYTIRLHGEMDQKYAKQVRLAGENWFQLLNGLKARFGPQFKEDVLAGKWHFVNGSMKAGNDFSEEDFKTGRQLKSKTIHLVPAVEGASAAFRIVLGVVLMVVGAYFGQAWMVQLGAAMALGGVVEMLTKPKTGGPEQRQDDKGSFIYNTAVNVTSQGGPIPLLYGRVKRASSVVITADFSSDEI